MRELQLPGGRVTMVDDSDYERAITAARWYVGADGYVVGYLRGSARKQVRLHRWLLDAPAGLDVDHRDGNPLNNCRDNLRLSTRGQNNANQKKVRGQSRYKGVSRHVASGRWTAQVKKDGRCYSGATTTAKRTQRGRMTASHWSCTASSPA